MFCCLGQQAVDKTPEKRSLPEPPPDQLPQNGIKVEEITESKPKASLNDKWPTKRFDGTLAITSFEPTSGNDRRSTNSGENRNSIPEKEVKQEEEVVKISGSLPVSKCPFLHGTPGPVPFPGYVHGTNPKICAHGCVPNPAVKKMETQEGYFLREAIEFQNLFHGEHHHSEEVKNARIKQIEEEIKLTGTYEHTFDELEYGVRLSWRNASKCSNRKFWDQLHLMDSRHVKTNKEMFDSLCQQMIHGVGAMGTMAMMNVFRPKHPTKEKYGPQIWNSQLNRFAAWKDDETGEILGDPSELAFTKTIQKMFGWEPQDGRTAFTILPLVLQMDENEPPELFEWDPSLILTVPIRHPKHTWLREMGLRWYGIPVVSAMEVEVGGILYSAIPFNGWYADTEVLRNLSDEGRYNLLPKVAQKMGMTISSESNLWRDAALLVLNEAIIHSYASASVAMVDHHTLMKQFYEWYHKELDVRGYSPGNWKWILPPVAAHTSKCYLGLKKMTDYTLKPALLYSPPFTRYATYWSERMSVQENTVRRSFDVATDLQKRIIKKWMARLHRNKLRMVVFYSTVTNTTKQLAIRMQEMFKNHFNISTFNTEEFSSDQLNGAQVVVYMLCTFGSGSPPASAKKFLAYLNSEHAVPVLSKLSFAVMGVGSTAYPRFCGAADIANSMLEATGCERILPPGKIDVVANTESSYQMFLKSFVRRLQTIRPEVAPVCRKLLGRIQSLGGDDGNKVTYKAMYEWFKVPRAELIQPTDRQLAKCVFVEEQLPDGSKQGSKSTCLTRLDFSISGHSLYYPGDHIAIYPTNQLDSNEMQSFLRGMGMGTVFELTDIISLAVRDPNSVQEFPFPVPNTVETIFKQFINLQSPPTVYALNIISEFLEDVEDNIMMFQAKGNYDKWLQTEEPRWVDIFNMFPSLTHKLPLNMFFQCVPRITARYYSIASANHFVPKDTVDILVGKVEYQTTSKRLTRHGQCSTFITRHLREGDYVSFQFHPAPSFRLPFYATEPLLLVGAGTGLAPFRGFWQERRRKQLAGFEMGPAVLVFGCRASDDDMMFAEELEEMKELGVFSDVIIAYSREPGHPKKYVQDVIKDRADMLEPMLSDPKAHLYICGSTIMAGGVSAAVAKVVGRDVFDALVERGNYHEDVFGITGNAVADRAKAAMQASSGQRSVEKLASALMTDGLEAFTTELKKVIVDPMFDINAADKSGDSLLHIAAKGGKNPVVALLIENKIGLNLLDEWGLTPLSAVMAAAHVTKNMQRCATQIEEAGGRLASSFHKNFYPLHIHVLNRDAEALKKELDLGSDPSQVDMLGSTALHLACVIGHEESTAMLIEKGCLVNMTNRFGKTAMQGALFNRHTKCIELCVKAGGGVVSGVRGDFTCGRPAAFDYDPQSGVLGKELGVTMEQLQAVQASWSNLATGSFPEKTKEALADYGMKLFIDLFEIAPKLVDLFPFKDPHTGKPQTEHLKTHGLKVMLALSEVVMGLTALQETVRKVTTLIEWHIKYGVKLEHYEVLCMAIKSSLPKALGSKMSEDEDAAWNAVLGLVAAAAKGVYSELEANEQET